MISLLPSYLWPSTWYIVINYHYGAVILLCHSFIIFVQYVERVFSPDYTVAQGNDFNRDVEFLELFALPYDTVAERCEYVSILIAS
ncbi:MAG: hypothetical protein Q7J35_05210 [Candidatus Methanoperedens sp.]|nr:hypothetical protein [Candidatus Methanoperedens sp.]